MDLSGPGDLQETPPHKKSNIKTPASKVTFNLNEFNKYVDFDDNIDENVGIGGV